MRLIDADELKKYSYRTDWNVPVVDVKDIDNAPTVDYTFEEAFQKTVCEQKLYCPERPQGEWQRHDEWRSGEYIGGFYHVNCPCEDGYYSKWETNFCPNCGAAMMKGGTE